MESNLVQAEFFNVGGAGTTLDSLLEECGERIQEGINLAIQGYEGRSSIKTVVRFFDKTGELTKIALKAERLKRCDIKMLEGFMGSRGLRRWLFDLRSRRLARKIIKLKTKAKTQAVECLRGVSQTSYDVAIERSDYSFRLMRKDEAHELLETAENSKGVWLFVFRPNDLLSDSNTMVACAM